MTLYAHSLPILQTTEGRVFCRLHHNLTNEQSHWPESTNAIMQHKPLYCESELWKKNELDMTMHGVVILPCLYRTKDASTV